MTRGTKYILNGFSEELEEDFFKNLTKNYYGTILSNFFFKESEVKLFY